MNLVFSLTAFLILTAYHVHLVTRVLRCPESTSIGANNRTRRFWVQSVMEKKLDILAVQTLRNLSMASSLLASTAILIGLAIINVSLGSRGIPIANENLPVLSGDSEIFWKARMVALAVIFIFAFFNFTLAIRHYNHAAFMINVPSDRDPSIMPATVSQTINRGALHYTLGMRCYYLAIPFAFWLLGDIALLTSASILVVLLWKFDHIKR